jgi:dTDP-4-dehydrorhamnose reductase
MTHLWITGAGGFIGGRLVERAIRVGRFDRIVALDLAAAPGDSPSATWMTLDIGDRAAVQAMARRTPPDIIVNAAAMTSVEACEARPEEARRANIGGPLHLAEVARARGAHLIQISTDYVFPGDEAQPGPYAEDDPTRPINQYGATKRAGEEAIVRLCGGETPYTIVRTALVYGPGGPRDFVSRVVGELAANQSVRVLRQTNTPTLVDDLADALLRIAERQTTGMYHIAGPDLVSRYEWAIAIAAHFGLNGSHIEQVDLEGPERGVARPRFGGLRCERWCALAEHGAPQPRGILASLRQVDWSLPTSKESV